MKPGSGEGEAKKANGGTKTRARIKNRAARTIVLTSRAIAVKEEKLLRRLHVGGVQKTAGLAAPQRGVMAVMGEQLAVIALLDDAAVLEHDQPIHLRDGREPVRDGDHGLAFHQRAEARLDRGFHFAVERRGRFVEDEDRRVLENDARDGDALALAAGELDAALADMGLVAAPALPILQFKR